MLLSKDEGVWLPRGLALRGLLAQAPQGEGDPLPPIRLRSSPKGGTFSLAAGEGLDLDRACLPLPACGERVG